MLASPSRAIRVARNFGCRERRVDLRLPNRRVDNFGRKRKVWQSVVWNGALAAKELKAVVAKCPTTAKVALRQFAESGSKRDFAEEMALEYRLAARIMMRHDFIEGVRAVLIDKDNLPQWDPAAPDGVSDAMLDAIFAPLPPGEEWTPFPA